MMYRYTHSTYRGILHIHEQRTIQDHTPQSFKTSDNLVHQNVQDRITINKHGHSINIHISNDGVNTTATIEEICKIHRTVHYHPTIHVHKTTKKNTWDISTKTTDSTMIFKIRVQHDFIMQYIYVYRKNNGI